MAKKRGLGRGLDALLGIESLQEDKLDSNSSNLSEIPIEMIETGRYQPRRIMSEEKLEELAASIRVKGIVQPIVVRPSKAGRFELIAGERRWRAAKIAGLGAMPALVKTVSNEEAMSIALIENIQREQLNSIEEAQALDRLVREFGMTHQEVAVAVGRSRASVSNLMRLLDLDSEVRDKVELGKLEMGHARALLGLPQKLQLEAANKAIENGLSVRQIEELVKRLNVDKTRSKVATKSVVDPDIVSLERNLSEKMGSEIRVKCNKKGQGSIIIGFRSLNELDGIIKRMN